MRASPSASKRFLVQTQSDAEDAEEFDEDEGDFETSDEDGGSSDQELGKPRKRTRALSRTVVSAWCVAQRTAVITVFFLVIICVGALLFWVRRSTEALLEEEEEEAISSSSLSFEEYLSMIGEDGYQDEGNVSLVPHHDGNLTALFHNESDDHYMLLQDLVGSIWFHSGVPAMYGGSSKSEPTNPYCKMSGSERCAMADMLHAASFTNVYPGGKTRCLLSDDLEYAFQVMPGSTDKLLIYFQGGGSCWDEDSATLKLCKQDFQEQPLTGIFDRSQADVPFADYTIVHVNYCSGDAHSGDTARDWIVHGDTAEQRGYENALAAVDWAKANTDRHLHSLVIAGCSAGSLGAQIWAKKLLHELSYDDAAVVADSYAGIFPDGVQGPVLQDSGICHTGLLSSYLETKCNSQSLTVQDVYAEAMSTFPDVTFSHIMYKTDKTQRAFFTAIHLSIKKTPWALSGAGFYRRLSDVEEFYSRNPNFVIFDMNDDHHCCTDLVRLREAEVDGTHLVEWLQAFPLEPGGEIHSQCAGQRSHPSGWNFGTSYGYCEPEAAERSYHRARKR